ncbi:MAG: 50S ribosomal protein L33 [Planctomycetota bacterium]|nr:MAG: 50S ribosomal protein L33 [Planctomycetota bacterium]
MAAGARVKVIMACQECKSRNYYLSKNKKKHPERMELNKYCPVCRTHTTHKETR